MHLLYATLFVIFREKGREKDVEAQKYAEDYKGRIQTKQTL